MAFTYDEALGNDVSKVRFHAGLTDREAPGVLSDEAITGHIAALGSWQAAVAGIYRRRAADLGRAATSTTSADGSVTYSPAELRALADHWDRLAAAVAPTPSLTPRARIGRMGDPPSDRYQTRTRAR